MNEHCKDCKECVYCFDCEDCKYCKYCNHCKNCDYCKVCKMSVNCFGCEDCKYCKYCNHCKNCKYCENCVDCSDCGICKGCRNCEYCWDCSQLLDKQFCIKNVQYTKEEYLNKIDLIKKKGVKTKKGHDYDWAINSYDCGKKVRRASWAKSFFIYLDKDNDLFLSMENDNNPIKLTSPLHLTEREATDWELYEEPNEEQKPKYAMLPAYDATEKGQDLEWAVEQIKSGNRVVRKSGGMIYETLTLETNFDVFGAIAKDWVLKSNDFIWAKSKINDGYHVSRLSCTGLDIHFDADKDIWIIEYSTLEAGEFITKWKMEYHTWESWEQYIERFRDTDDWIILTIQQEG